MIGMIHVCLLWGLFNSACSHNCSIRNLYADCSFRNLDGIPKLPDNITGLDLTGNSISKLKNNSFKRFYNLRALLMDKNSIFSIQERAFAGLDNLTKLTLSRNNINITDEHFKRPIFKHTPQLSYLDLSKNVNTTKITTDSEYPDKNLANLRNLRELKMDLYPKPIFGSGFKKLLKLESLVFKNCFVQALKNDTFKYLGMISCLSMTKCPTFGGEFSLKIPTIEYGVFNHFRFLRRLDLSESALTLPALMESFHSFQYREMEILNLYNVNPRELMWVTKTDYYVKVTQNMVRFYKNMCVNHINLGKNGIAEVAVGTLFSMKNLTCFKSYVLSENNFMLTFPKAFPEIFRFITESINLEVFDFSYMLIQMPSVKPLVVPSSFEGCINTNNDDDENEKSGNSLLSSQYKSLGSNGSVMLPCPKNAKVLRFCNVIIPFYVEFNLILKDCPVFDFVDLSYLPVTQFDFRVAGIEQTKTVNISGLDCFYMKKTFMNSFRKVKHLVLQNGNLDRAFSSGNYFLNELCEMLTLDISLNHLSELHPDSMCSETPLRKINLSTNSFDEFPSALMEFDKLHVIDLTFNRISHINISLTKKLDDHNEKKEHLRLLLKGNVFACICDNVKFIQWVYKTTIHLADSNKYECVLPDGQRMNMKLVYKDMQMYLGKCQNEILLKFGLFGISLMGIVLVCSIFAYSFRWRILYFFYRLCKLPRPPSANMFDFDAFIAYTGEQYTWVWKRLRIKLEEERSLKLCLHDREFELGETIAQNIVDFICKSRKIVFDITPEYLKAKWCEFELEMARMEMFQRGTPNAVIVIIRGGVQPQNMPPCIRNIWKHVTCIIFPEDENDTEAYELFWSRLYDAIVD